MREELTTRLGRIESRRPEQRQTDNVVPPSRKEVQCRFNRSAEETLLRYNGMLVSVFTLLAGAAEQASVVRQTLHAERDFWLAEVDLQQALAGIGIVHPGLHLPGRMGGTPFDSHHATH